MPRPGRLDSKFPIKFTAGANLIDQTPPRNGFVWDRDEIYNGVLTPQARMAHQPIQDSKAQNSPINTKIAARTAAFGMRQAPARRKTTAVPPRAARPFLSIFGFMRERCGIAATK
jgi:hypothetical protein